MTGQNVLDAILGLLVLAWSYAELRIVVAHVVINLVVAIAASLKVGDFNLSKVGEFLIHKLLPYVGVYFVIRLAGDTAGLGSLSVIAWAAIEITLTGDLMDNWVRLGLPLPDALKGAVVKPIDSK